MMDKPAPTRSSWACCGSFDLGTRKLPRASATRMIGTLTRKTDPNQKWPSSQPLATGPTEPVAEGAGREQQAGEHERVGGDDPLQLRGRGVELARQRRDRDVEARVADEHDQQAQAQDAERPPAPVVQTSCFGRAAHSRVLPVVVPSWHPLTHGTT